MLRDPSLGAESKEKLKIICRSGDHLTVTDKGAGELWFVAQVKDTGPGLSVMEQENLFEPFRQAKGALHTGEGTGLGLAISRKYARLMAGDVTVASQPGQGATFCFAIPMRRSEAAIAFRGSAGRKRFTFWGSLKSRVAYHAFRDV